MSEYGFLNLKSYGKRFVLPYLINDRILASQVGLILICVWIFMKIDQNVSLSDKNWFGTGGTAKFYCEPQDEKDFEKALNFARINSLEIFVLGHGANILISDEGFCGLVIRPKLNDLVVDLSNNRVKAGSGVGLHDLINFCLENNLIGLEEFSGIPGTVGGSIFINIHYFEFLFSQFVVSACVIDRKTGEVFEVKPDWFNFGYNVSTLQNNQFYLINATFQLRQADFFEVAFARGRSIEIIRHRNARYPVEKTCGSFFRNFHLDEITFLINEKKIPFVAYYLDKIGVKGALRIGGAAVSHQHSNMIVAQEGATSSDIILLAKQMQQSVFNTFGVIPQPECRLIGFSSYPLLTI